MGTKVQQVRARVKALGAHFEVLRKKPLDCQVYSPIGATFEGELHILVGNEKPGQPPDDVYADLLQRMEMGVFPCETQNCEVCCEVDE